MARKSNPALSIGFDKVISDGSTMTIRGTVTKIFILLAILSATFAYSFIASANPSINFQAMMVVSGIGSLILGFATAFFPRIAQFTAVFYAAFEGMLLGSISVTFESIYPGIVLPAILLTLLSVLGTLIIYRRTPVIADKIRKGVFIAMFAIMGTFFIGFITSLFGYTLPIYGSGIIGIAFSLIVVCVAVLNLIIDYDFILKSTQMGAPKYMEWYGAFGLMVTLIWLYVEILNLLSKIASNNR